MVATVAPKEEESDSQSIIKKDDKKDNLNQEVREALRCKACMLSQIYSFQQVY